MDKALTPRASYFIFPVTFFPQQNITLEHYRRPLKTFSSPSSFICQQNMTQCTRLKQTYCRQDIPGS